MSERAGGKIGDSGLRRRLRTKAQPEIRSHTSPSVDIETITPSWISSNPITSIVVLGSLARVLSVAYLLLLHPYLIPETSSFDTSASVFSSPPSASLLFPHNSSEFADLEPDGVPTWLIPLARWDAFYYIPISLHGYQVEKEMAFLPLWPIIMRVGGELISWIRGDDGMVRVGDVLIAGVGISNLVTVINPVMFYLLTKSLTSSPSFTHLSSLLYALSPSPAPLSGPYTEPMFAFFTFSGWLLAESSRRSGKGWRKWAGALLLAGSAGVKSVGLLGGFVIGWIGVVEPFLEGDRSLKRNWIRILRTTMQCLMVVAPFVAFQYLAYKDICLSQLSTRPEWCSGRIPLAYTSIQTQYWDIGFMKYWTLQQLPNFLLPLPILLVSVWVIRHYILNFTWDFPPPSNRSQGPRPVECFRTFILRRNFLPYAIHHTAMTCILLFNSHVQITLRVCSALPFIFWGIASLAFALPVVDEVDGNGEEKDGYLGMKLTRLGRWWIRWVIIWGFISLVLWGGFYPPA